MPVEVKHVGIVVKDIGKSMERFSTLCGLGPFTVRESESRDAIPGRTSSYKRKLALAQAGAIEIELIEPGKGEHAWEFLQKRGEGVHHLGVGVSDLEKEVARFKEMGIGVLQRHEGERYKIAYMDTEAVVGIVLELQQKK